MIISTEIFVLIIFVLAFPIFIFLFRSTGLPGSKYFLATFVFLLLSNIFTVLEEFFLPRLFNILENGSIALGAFWFFMAVRELVSRQAGSPSQNQVRTTN